MLPTPQQARTPFRSLDVEDVDVEARALKLFDGKTDDLFTRNPWRRVRTFDTGTLAFPLGLEVTARDAVIDALGGARVALAWDDATVLEAPPQNLEAGDVLAMRLNTPRGRRLEVWADDADEVGSVTTVAAGQLESRQAARDKREADENAQNPLDAITKPIGDALETAKIGAVVLVVGVVVVVLAVASRWDGALPTAKLGG